MAVLEIEVLNAKDSKPITKCSVTGATKITEIKELVARANKKLTVHRQSIRLQQSGKSVKDDDTVDGLNLRDGSKLYVKDLGPQIGWKTVFLAEYAGPLIVYLWIYTRPWLFYGDKTGPISTATHIAAGCWSLHYAKRLLETVFVHRFSHATMPFRNLFKNCIYYWGFTAYVAYHVNHPLYTSPSIAQVYTGLGLFLLFELGNFSIHINLRNLRPPGTKIRKIPQPDGNPLTALFNFVSCPNYFYETTAWLSFTIMTQCLPAGLFTLAGFYQMAVWALGKHRNYKKEFKDYPKNRKAIIPFVL